MEQELAYSIHLGSDKNKTTKAKEIAKNNPSETTSFSNNGIQNAKQLSKVNKHNLRDYGNNKENICVIYGTENLYQDVQDLYFDEFEEAKLEYNSKQTREDRKIDNYFKHISQDKQKDLACEFIIELGDMDFWNDKDTNYRMRMVNVYKDQVRDLMRIVPEFKVANAVIHFDEVSPHLHLVGVPIKDDYKRGMRKQPAKSKVFTKESLTRIQDEMRISCIKSYNLVYSEHSLLKQKKKGRNQDINIKDMGNYREIKQQLKKKEQKITEANNQTKKLDNTGKNINELLDNLKPTKLNKNNMIISNEDVEKIKNYTSNVKDTTQTIRSVNDLNIEIKELENSTLELRKENYSLKYQLEQKNDEINNLKQDLSLKDKIIGKLQSEKESLKEQLQKFKGFWHSIMGHFHKKICYEKDENYKIVSDDLYKNGIFTDDENQIANDIHKKVKTPDEISKIKENRKKNDTRF
ncbi:MAG: plasmid recombination protein [Clostridia bacterium]|nr:plasmid recombination protein [Clostridia bacterium]